MRARCPFTCAPNTVWVPGSMLLRTCLRLGELVMSGCSTHLERSCRSLLVMG